MKQIQSNIWEFTNHMAMKLNKAYAILCKLIKLNQDIKVYYGIFESHLHYASFVWAQNTN